MVTQIATNVVRTARRIATVEHSTIAKAVGQIILGVVRQGLGGLAANAMETAARELTTTNFDGGLERAGLAGHQGALGIAPLA